jgi:hypothetical protein
VLKIAPSEVKRIGEKSTRPIQRDWWTLISPLPRGESFLQDHIEALLKVLEPKALELSSLGEKCSFGINCVGYYYGANPGLGLSAALIRRLAALGLGIDFDLYNYAETDAP